VNPPLHIFNLGLDELKEVLGQHGFAGYRAAQLVDWVYAKHTTDAAAMTSFSRADRDKLAQLFRFLSARVVRHQVATDGVQKLLLQWDDGDLAAAQAGDLPALSLEPLALPILSENGDGAGDDPRRQTECVLIPADNAKGEGKPRRRTACISSQVGCPVGCRFCASGLGGLDGNLSAGRIVEQVWRLGALPGVERVTHVVFMGMGEPLANFNEVVKAIRIITAPR